ncbi:hypothetical protein GUY44_08535 [Pimelobacter simplex]|uniref:Uncharacterized protein n=1 Tax=Nocardioides simplex TaxID=2045 RepID=A0A0A1DEP6_NOCSI|nr:hypothetical protein [Pimelobacter simplex]AIY15686.1 hypothetical protein KR76_00860 [Pimelobacter simplex]MCG8150523.1 hypothetical protein [Pimelobacter simplex]GEB15045.1 hypothetical protein NSI01_33600 [Pimelobacter simplex]SFM87170.1 hypothetical protein SAMN05421671_3892 [Pimelobacter simplex]
MRRDADPLTARASVLVAGLLAGLLALLATPALAAESPTSVGLTVLALALAALLHLTVAGSLAPSPVPAHARAGRSAPALTSRITDPVHHPVRPRAPGAV